MPKKKTQEEFVNELKKTHPNLTVLGNYIGDKKYVEVRCDIHNHIFMTKPNWLHHGANCQKCYNDRRGETLKKTPSQLLLEFRQVHGYKYTYPHLDEEYKTNKSKITIVCPIHGEFKQTINHHLRGQGCSKCADTKNGLNKRLTTEEFIKKAQAKHGDKYDYSLVDYQTSETPIRIICKIHGEFKQIPHTHLYGCGCPKCQQSHLENMVEKILKENGVEYISQYKDDKLIGRKSVDFFLPHHKIAIECQGGQHFQEVEHFGGKDILNETIRRDITKFEELTDNGINVIYIINKTYKRNTTNKKFYGIYDKNVLIAEEIEDNPSKLTSFFKKNIIFHE